MCFMMCRTQPGHWLKAIDFGCTVYMEPGQPLQRKTGTPMFMVGPSPKLMP